MQNSFKIYIKDKLILFTMNKNIMSRDKQASFYIFQGEDALILEFERFIKNKRLKTLIVYRRKNIDQLFRVFIGRFKLTKAAGGAVINKKEEVLMIHRHGRWDLPKGKKKRGERNKETALREVKEETGVNNLRIKKKLAVTYHFYRRNRRLIIKKTHWYLMKGKRKDELNPALDEGIQKVKWIPFEKARRKSNKTFRSISEVLCKAMEDGGHN